jgi:hypothetical protein
LFCISIELKDLTINGIYLRNRIPHIAKHMGIFMLLLGLDPKKNLL